MMPQSGNFENYGDVTAGSSLMGFFKSPGTLLQGYNQVPDSGNGSTMPLSEGLQQHAAQLFARENLRGMSAFFGMGEDVAFNLQLNPSLLMARIKHNGGYFYLNYLYMTAILFCLNVLFKPTAWIGVGLLAAMWVGAVNTIQNEQMLKVASAGMAIVSAVVLSWVLSGAFWFTLYVSAAIITAHLLFRNTATLEMMNADPMQMIPDNAGFYQGPQLVGA